MSQPPIKQDQSAGNGSVNIQAGTLNVGLTYDEARNIALDVYKANALMLAQAATETARHRAEEITDAFLQQLKTRNPDGLKQAATPDFQIALYDAQKAYARTGDKAVSELLVDLLVDRTTQQPRSIRELVLTESLQVVPRLNASHVDSICVVFILRYTKNNSIVSVERFNDWFQHNLRPFTRGLTKSNTCYQHLAYSGAATIEMGSINLGTIFQKTYPGIFCVGRPLDQYQQFIEKYPGLRPFLIPALYEQTNVQLPPLSEEHVDAMLENIGIPESDRATIWQTHLGGLKKPNEILQILSEAVENFSELQNIWNESQLKNTILTSVGIAIGHANYQRITGDKAPLSIWIPD